jgi:hypothetical protein
VERCKIPASVTIFWVQRFPEPRGSKVFDWRPFPAYPYQFSLRKKEHHMKFSTIADFCKSNRLHALRRWSGVTLALALAVTFTLGHQALAQSQGKGQPPAGHDHDFVTSSGNKIHVHFSAPEDKTHRAAEAASGGGAAGSDLLIYSGGSVMRNPVNYLIFWQPTGGYATSFPPGYVAGIEKFFQNVGGTPFYNIVTQYNDTTGAPVPNAASLGAPSFVDTTSAAASGCDGTSTGAVGATPHCPLTDADIQAEVDYARSQNTAWGPDSVNVEYFVFTPSNVGECDGPDKKVPSDQDCWAINGGLGPNELGPYCAYHGDLSSTGFPYAFMPFASNGSCYGDPTVQDPNIVNFPNGAVLDVVLSTTSHEMIESNTDPLINAWLDTNGAEIGDKCAYNYGYAAPDGTDLVLNGFGLQIQQEFSNDVDGCTKRYGDVPVTAIPTSLSFGEVASGATAEMDLPIQNSGAGDLNILNIRQGSGSDVEYSLFNVPPTTATLKESEGLTVKTEFSPFGGFKNPTATVLIDTDQTTFNTTTKAVAGEYSVSETGQVGVAPDAICTDRLVPTDPNLCTTANVSINNGSFDPDGELVTVSQSPAGPYTLGKTAVNLTVTDSGADHQTASCASNVTVQDQQKPTITCPAPKTVLCTSSSGAMVSLMPSVFDNCPAVTSSCAPTSGSTFGFGTTPTTCTATDASGNTNSCLTSVTVQDVPPTIASVVAFPNVLTPPNKKLDPVVITVKDTDPCDPAPVCSISGVTANVPINPSSYKITGPLTLNLQANGNGGHTLTYVVTVACTDAHGGSTSAQTSVSAPAH